MGKNEALPTKNVIIAPCHRHCGQNAVIDCANRKFIGRHFAHTTRLLPKQALIPAVKLAWAGRPEVDDFIIIVNGVSQHELKAVP